MDGLNCREITLNNALANKDKRIDSQFWTTYIPKNVKYHYSRIGDILVSSQYGISVDMNTEKRGYPIFRMNELHHMLADLEVEKYADISSLEYQSFSLQDKDVLFNRTNSYEWVGRTGVYYKNDDTHFTYASYLVRLVPDCSVVLPEYLTAFLNTSIGIKAIKSRARQSVNQTNVNPEEVKEIEIPLLSMDFQKYIEQLFILANKKRIEALNLYRQAETELGSVLPISSLVPSCPYSEKSLSSSFLTSGRLDAEYYQPQYQRYVDALNTNETVQSLCNLYDVNFAPIDDETYCYIELANVGKSGDVSNVEQQEGFKLPSRARRIVKTGQIIVSSIEGSLQSCALITDEYDGALCSTGFFVLDSDYINPETLLVLFKSEPIQALMKQRCSGTILTAMNKDEFLSMPLPMIDNAIQQDIALSIQESFTLRKQSKHLLECAKHAVEMAIEQGEEAALHWVKSQM